MKQHLLHAERYVKDCHSTRPSVLTSLWYYLIWIFLVDERRGWDPQFLYFVVGCFFIMDSRENGKPP